MKLSTRTLLAAVGLFVLACEKPPITPRVAEGRAMGSITVTSTSFTDGSIIPVDHTCDGSDAFPSLVLSSPPEGTKSLVVIVEDPDSNGGALTHMVAFNISPDLRKLAINDNLSGAGENARFGLNDFRVTRYSGPCPPKGEAHRYVFRVLALDTMLKVPEGTPRGQIDEAIDRHILGAGMITGQFGH